MEFSNYSAYDKGHDFWKRLTRGNERLTNEKVQELLAIAAFDVFQLIVRKQIDLDREKHKYEILRTDNVTTIIWTPFRRENDSTIDRGPMVLIDSFKKGDLCSQVFWLKVPRRLDKYTLFGENEKAEVSREKNSRGEWFYTYTNGENCLKGRNAIPLISHLSMLLAPAYGVMVDPVTKLAKLSH